MSTITAVLEADIDGTLHVPLPQELQNGKVAITAVLKLASEGDPDEQEKRRAKARAALNRLRERGTFKGIDVVAWQRDIRADRPLPGREE